MGSAACNYTYQTLLRKDQVQYESVVFMSVIYLNDVLIKFQKG
jgi:hypothetical protein